MEKSYVQFWIAQTYYSEKNRPAARAEYAKVLEIIDGHPYFESRAQFLIGLCYSQEKNVTMARTEFAKVLELDGYPKHKSEAQYHIGYSYELEKDYLGAVAEYAKIGTIPGARSYDISSAQLQIGYCYANEENKPAATSAFLKVFKIKDENFTLKKLAWEGLVGLKPDWNVAVLTMGGDLDWSGLCFLGKANARVGNYEAAQSAINDAYNSLPTLAINASAPEKLEAKLTQETIIAVAVKIAWQKRLKEIFEEGPE